MAILGRETCSIDFSSHSSEIDWLSATFQFFDSGALDNVFWLDRKCLWRWLRQVFAGRTAERERMTAERRSGWKTEGWCPVVCRSVVDDSYTV